MPIRRAVLTVIAVVAMLLCGLALHLPGGSHAMVGGSAHAMAGAHAPAMAGGSAHARAAGHAHATAAWVTSEAAVESGPAAAAAAALVTTSPTVSTPGALPVHELHAHPEVGAMVCLLVLVLASVLLPAPLARAAITPASLAAQHWRVRRSAPLVLPRTPSPQDLSISRT